MNNQNEIYNYLQVISEDLQKDDWKNLTILETPHYSINGKLKRWGESIRLTVIYNIPDDYTFENPTREEPTSSWNYLIGTWYVIFKIRSDLLAGFTTSELADFFPEFAKKTGRISKTDKEIAFLTEIIGLASHDINRLFKHFEIVLEEIIFTPNRKMAFMEKVKDELDATLPEEVLTENIKKLVKRHYSLPLNDIQTDRISHEIVEDFFKMGPLEELLSDDDVSDIYLNTHRIFYELKGKMVKSFRIFNSYQRLTEVLDQIEKRFKVNEFNNSVMRMICLDFGDNKRALLYRLQNGDENEEIRIHKGPKRVVGIKDLIKWGALTEEMSSFLEIISDRRLLFSGNDGSGKNTLLQVVMMHGFRERTHVGLFPIQGMKNDYIFIQKDSLAVRKKQEDLPQSLPIIGPGLIGIEDCEGYELWSVLQRAAAGGGDFQISLSAESPRDVLDRVLALSLLADSSLDKFTITDTFSRAFDFIIHMKRFGGGQRRVTSISEIVREDNGEISLKEVFCFVETGKDPIGKILGEHQPTGHVPAIIYELKDMGWAVRLEIFKKKAEERSND
jgi:pilus assembly protein CpaF